MNRSLHVGLLTSDLRHKHGWGAYCLSLVEALRDMGVRLTVIASRGTPMVSGIDVLPILPSLSPRDRWMLPRLIAARGWARHALRDCDVIHSAVEPFAPLGAMISGSRPLIVTGHGSYVRVNRAWPFPMNALYAWAFRRARLVCVSRYTAWAAQQAVPGVETVVVNNGVNARRFQNLPTPEATRGPVVLSVGAVKARKGTLELIQAMPAVREQFPDAQCIILGNLSQEPEYVARARTEIERLGLQTSVQLPGFVPDETLLRWYGGADVFVLPSMNAGWKFEGFGLSLIEASAAGLPVIGTTDCGAEDAVGDGVTGLLVSQSEIATALPAAIIRLLSDRALAARMGAAGKAKAQQQTWSRVARQMLDVYAEKLSERKLSSPTA